jgi:hypothetical protein
MGRQPQSSGPNFAFSRFSHKGFYRPKTAYLVDAFPPSSHVFGLKHAFLNWCSAART